MFNNLTKNQHFISQVEQKLNCINPKAARGKRKIFEFKALDRDAGTFQLTSPKGVLIEKNLSLKDLYTFEVFSDEARCNFEAFFKKYEDRVEKLTFNLLLKVEGGAPITEVDVTELIACKFLSFIRTPYGIKKALNTFRPVLNSQPLESSLLSEFSKITTCEINTKYLADLGVSLEEYREWLRLIFLLLAIELDGKNLAEHVVYSILDKEQRVAMLRLDIFDQHNCLLSDRGYVDYSAVLPGDVLCISFNLTKNALLTIYTCDNSVESLKLAAPSMADHYESLARRFGGRFGLGEISLNVYNNDLEFLGNYNSNVIYQCFKTFYSSGVDFIAKED